MFDERDNFIGQQNKAQHKKAAAAPRHSEPDTLFEF